MRRLFRPLLPVAVAFASTLPACSSDDDTSPGDSLAGHDAGNDAGTADTGSGSVDGATSSNDSGDASSSCTSFASLGPAIAIQSVTTTAPAPAGGALRDGTYQITQATVYGAAVAVSVPGASARGTLAVAGGQLSEHSVITVDGQTSTRDEVAVYVFDGSATIAGADTCPANGGAASLAYTATADGFVAYSEDGGAALTWTLISD